MNDYNEDIEVQDNRPNRGHEDQEDDDFSMSSYDGDQTDSLVIKPPQAVVQRREKRDKRDRHRHKAERRKDRHRSREHLSGHEERRRQHRRHRDPERRHEKHRDRSSKHAGDLRNKIDKERKLAERGEPLERRRVREREDEYIDEREIYEIKHREYLNSRVGPMGPMGHEHHRDRRPAEEKAMHLQANYAIDPQMSPRERAEKEKRMQRFMAAEKQKENSQREADQRRQKREEEKRIEDHRYRAEISMLRNAAKQAGGVSPSYEGIKQSYISSKKRKKAAQEVDDDEASEHEMVELISDDEMSPYIDDTMVEKPTKEKSRKKKKKKKSHEEVNDEDVVEEEDQVESKRSSSISLPTSDSDSSSNSSESEREEDEGEEEEEDEEEEYEEVAKGDESPIKIKDKDEKRVKDSNSESSTEEESSAEEEEKNLDEDSDTKTEKGANQSLENSPVLSPLEIKEDLPMYLPAIMGCRSVDEFECLNRIAEGTYGVVYRAREKATNIIVALKRLKMEKEKEGFPITSLREVNTLLKGQHENIVTVREIVVGSNMDKIYIVMDYVEHDLKSLMETMSKKKQVFTIGEVKTLMIQLLRAIHHLHDNWILHRDLKTSNLLLSHRGILKVGDFGLAREYGSPLKQYTPIVVTLWYRAPELLLGCKEYSCPIDAWSVGCIFGELLNMEPMFPGKSEIDELNKIFKELGTPSEKIWPGYSQLPVIKKTQFAFYPYNHLKERFKTRLSTEGFNLLNSFLTYNPNKRVTCAEALAHDYFRLEDPAPIDPAMFPTWPAKSENPLGVVKKAASPKPPSGGKNFKALGDGEDEIAGFFLGGPPGTGPGFTLKF